MDHYELIRRMHFVDGLSGREIAKRLGHVRKTVTKALTHAAPPPHKGLGQTREKPSLGPLIPIIDAWLEQDLSRPRKQRHTGERIYASSPESVGEFWFGKGSESGRRPGCGRLVRLGSRRACRSLSCGKVRHPKN